MDYYDEDLDEFVVYPNSHPDSGETVYVREDLYLELKAENTRLREGLNRVYMRSKNVLERKECEG